MEPIEVLNQRLADTYGLYESDKPRYRIVHSESQLEWRYGVYEDRTPEGWFIRRVKETRYVPKYRQWIQNKYVLEQLTIVPDINSQEIGEKLSYEPVWVYEDKQGNPLPPKWEVTEVVVACIYNALSGNAERVKDPLWDLKTGEQYNEFKRNELDKLEKELFGGESTIADLLHHKEGIVVPNKEIK